MCMSLGLALPGCAILATDTATNGHEGGSWARWYERPDKLWAAGEQAFMGFSGDRILGDAVARVTKGGRNAGDLGGAIRRTFDERAPGIVARFPDAKPEKTMFLRIGAVAGGFRVRAFAGTGEVLHDLSSGLVISWPPEILDADVHYAAVAASIGHAGDLGALVALVGDVFASTAPEAPSMSRDIHVAVLWREGGDVRSFLHVGPADMVRGVLA